MEFDPFPVALPAFIALGIKGIILVYAKTSRVRNKQTGLFLLGLIALALQDIALISHYYALSHGERPVFEFTLFYVFAIIALGVFLHLALTIATEYRWINARRNCAFVVYVYGAMLLALLVTTDSLISGFAKVGPSLTRVPGPFFWLFEIYAIGCCLGISGLFTYGARRQDTGAKRAKNALLFTATLPGVGVILILLALLHYDIKWVNAAVVLPLAITVFLVVCAYAIYQHRLFDVHFLIPWSKTRRRKTAFHEGIRGLIAEIADLPSASQIIQRLSDTLRCPVALLGPSRVLYAGDTAKQMTNLSDEELIDVDHILVAEEIVDSRPQIYNSMKSNGVAAIVPFHPHSESASGWLLLGASFNDQVHSPLDFELVEELFGKMSELFVDRFVTLRSQLRAANRQLRAVSAQNETLQEDIRRLQTENKLLASPSSGFSGTNGKQDVDQIVHSIDAALATPLTFLGRDDDMVRALKNEFRDVKSFVGPSTAAMRRTSHNGVVVCRVADVGEKLARHLAQRHLPQAAVLYGPKVETFVDKFRPRLRDTLVDVIPGLAPPSLMCTRIRSLMYLSRNTFSVSIRDQPLLGISPVVTSFMQKLQIFSGFADPILLIHDDPGLALSAATYLHEQSECDGRLIEASVHDLEGAGDSGHTYLLMDIDAYPADEQERLANLMQDRNESGLRLIVGCHYDHVENLSERIDILTQGFTVHVPRLHERRDDIPLLIHYYTLGFNLNSGTFKSLNRAEVRSLKLHEPSWTLEGLRRATIEFLASKGQATAPEELDFSTSDSIETVNQDRSLEELVSEFESRIIKQTLERCDGNKSKAARILGLRPNTLHYKLERFGLNAAKRRRK